MKNDKIKSISDNAAKADIIILIKDGKTIFIKNRYETLKY